MSNKVFDYVIFSSAIVIMGIGLFLERAGVFLYLGYMVVGLTGTILALLFLFWGMRFLKSRRWARFYLAILISLSLTLAGWTLGNFDSSPRKHFYLAATQIKPEDSMDSVRKKMAQYESWQGQQDHESFRFSSGPGTSDVVIVHYDVKTGKVIDVNLSLD